jgi:DNA-binding YbaB/EbfC family protein
MIKGLGGFGDMAKMMKAAKDMQDRMQQMQASLDTITVTGESGAGLVRATATAKGDLTALEIDPSIFVPSEKEVVEDLIMARITQDMGLPADMKLPF